MMRNFAVEFGPHNVRVNAILPGVIRTDFARALWEDPAAEAALRRTTPLRRIGEPDDIAGAAVFLATKAGALHHRPRHRYRWWLYDRVRPMSVRSEIHRTVAVLRFGESPVNSLGSTTRRELVEAIDAAVADSRIEGIVVVGNNHLSLRVRISRSLASLQ